MTKMTDARLNILKGARYIDTMKNVSVVRPAKNVGFEAVSERRNISWLADNGYLTPSNWGDWYITNKAVEALANAHCEGEFDVPR